MAKLNGLVVVINATRISQSVCREGCVMVIRSNQHIISLVDRKKG